MEPPANDEVEKKCEVVDAINKLIKKNFPPKEGQETHDITLSLTEDSYLKIFNILNKNLTLKVAPIVLKKPVNEKEKKVTKPITTAPTNITKLNSDTKKTDEKPK